MIPAQFLEALHNFPFLLPLLALLLVWTLAIKGVALWFSARNGQKLWFVVLLVVNTFGVVEVVYLVGFRKDKTVLVTGNVKPVADEEVR